MLTKDPKVQAFLVAMDAQRESLISQAESRGKDHPYAVVDYALAALVGVIGGVVDHVVAAEEAAPPKDGD